MPEIRVLIAEDHETVREGLRLIVDTQEDMQVCGEAGDGREAIRLAQELAPDVLLMDISMPELNGLKAAAKLKRVAPQIKILRRFFLIFFYRNPIKLNRILLIIS